MARALLDDPNSISRMTTERGSPKSKNPYDCVAPSKPRPPQHRQNGGGARENAGRLRASNAELQKVLYCILLRLYGLRQLGPDQLTQTALRLMKQSTPVAVAESEPELRAQGRSHPRQKIGKSKSADV